MRTTILLAAVLTIPALVSAQIGISQDQLQPGLSDHGAVVADVPLLRPPETIEVPFDYFTISEAIDAAKDGDTILVHPGGYQENVDFMGKDVLLIATEGPEVTIIIASGQGPTVTFQNGEGPTATLSGFYILGGIAPTAGGAILCDNGSSPRISNCYIFGGHAPKGGGIACLNRSSPVIHGSTITECSADEGGGIYAEASRPSIHGNTISKNVAVDGAGVRLRGASARVVGNTLTENAGTGQGGGLYADWGADPHIEGNTFSLNTSGSTGGGAALWSEAPTIQNNVFDQNDSYLGGGMYLSFTESGAVFSGNSFTANTGGYGAGLYCEYVFSVLEASAFLGNQATGHGGGIYGIDCDMTLRDVAVRGNSSGDTGGGIVGDYSSICLVDSVVSLNVAGGDGGGLYLLDGDSVLVNDVIHDNQSSGDGGGLYLSQAGAVITNVTITRNDATGFGGGLAAMSGSTPRLTNTILWDDDAFADLEIHTDGSLVIAHRCDVEYGWAGDNLLLPPLFANAAGGDFHLTGFSPCIDTGDNSAAELPPQDYEGDARQIDGDLVPGAVVDMGADEYGG